MRTSIEVRPGAALEMRMQASPDEPPIQIDHAIVQWRLTFYIGVEFISLSPHDDLRLKEVIKRLENQPVHLL